MASALRASLVLLPGAHAAEIRAAALRILATSGRRQGISRQIAQQALDAEQQGKVDTFYSLGCDVLNREDQSRRGRVVRHPDALNGVLSAYLEEFPKATTSEIVLKIERATRDCAHSEILLDFVGDTLTFAPRGDALFKDISRSALIKRIQRLRRR